ncbi:methionyl-tRNA formyltransferase [Litchfieldella anticariensis]|uniref:methionyl-tRNA formyltransferase n=1 Tax=Litchfieldella anticariensis TaxID=258591 RepID=UPI0003990472|nr:methionyl-tRNA formyltransferase [Halomonas anticariensis]
MQKATYILATSKPWHKPMLAKYLTNESQFLWANDPEQLNDLVSKEKNIRYIFFLHWNWLVPEILWKKIECVCFHMTDVPYGRGGSPLQNLIVRGHKETKLSALRMVQEMDAGPVYTKRPLPLEGTAQEIYLRAGKLSFEIIQWMIDNHPEPVPQQGEPVIFKRRRPEQSELPETGDIGTLYDHIRMLDAPTYPLAFIEYGEFIVEFSDADVQGDELSASVRIRKKQNQGEI